MLKILLIFLFTGVNLCLVIAQSNIQMKNRRSGKDLPVKLDLDTFIKPIEILTNNVTDIEINYALGIFFTNVHLKRILLDKGQNLPVEILSRIKAIVDKNEKSLLYFHKTARDDIQFMERDHKIISYLFDDSTYWMERLKKFKYETEPTHSYSYLKINYFKWQTYTENVDNVFQWNPTPKNSDVCLVTLSINRKYKGNSTSWCPIAKTCYNMVTNGTNFGYALCHREDGWKLSNTWDPLMNNVKSHVCDRTVRLQDTVSAFCVHPELNARKLRNRWRLALLLMAHLGRGCYIWSVQEDEELKLKLCGMAYSEAEYIAMNGYGIVDLMLEIMFLCATDGRVQFLRRTWLLKMFDFQNKDGCFGIENSLMNHNRRTELAGCNSHTTGLASGTFAAAVRFILEEYY